MKTKEVKTWLNLNKETIANLNIPTMAEVVGGTGGTTGTNYTELDCDPKIPTTKCT